MPFTGSSGNLYVVGLREAAFNEYGTPTDALQSIIPSESTNKRYAEWLGIAPPGQAPVKTRGADMAVADLFVEYPKRVEHETLALAIRMFYEDIKDELYGVGSKIGTCLGKCHKIAEIISRADLLLNGGFVTTIASGYDGLALYSTSHTLQGYDLGLNYTSAGGIAARGTSTWSNRLATDSDFDYLSSIDAMTLLRRTPGRDGNPLEFMAAWAFGPVELWAAFKEVFGSMDRPDTANRSKSAVGDLNITPVVSPFFTDTDAWGLASRDHDLKLFVRQSLELKKRDAIGSWDEIQESLSRHGKGFSNPRGVVATPGQ